MPRLIANPDDADKYDDQRDAGPFVQYETQRKRRRRRMLGAGHHHQEHGETGCEGAEYDHADVGANRR